MMLFNRRGAVDKKNPLEVSIMESRIDDCKKIANIPFSQLAAASTVYWFWYDGVLRHDAAKRTFIFANNFNSVANSSPVVKFLMYDSAIVKAINPTPISPNVSLGTGANSRGYTDNGGINQLSQVTPNFSPGLWAPYHSTDYQNAPMTARFGAPVDSFLIQLTSAAALPTAGSFDVYVREVGVR